MMLRCPHCASAAAYDRQSLLGKWLICPACYGHFAWREAAPSQPVNAASLSLDRPPLGLLTMGQDVTEGKRWEVEYVTLRGRARALREELEEVGRLVRGMTHAFDNVLRAVEAPRTILLAEDDDLQRGTAQRALEKLGYRVIAAADGEQALLLYDEHQHEIDLILSDTMMPKTGGPELYRAVHERNPRVKFVLASAATAAEVEEHSGLRGVPFIQKPWSLTQLARLVQETLAVA